LSVAMLLEWVGKHRANPAFAQAGQAMHAAIEAALANPATRTADIGGQLGTQAFTQAVLTALNTR